MSEQDDDDLTRERLLSAAETLFAEKGYHGVTVREITASARSNLAAVNYHFGNKRNLYLEVFRCRWIPRARRVQESFRKSLGSKAPSSPAQVVQALAKAFLEGPLSEEERVCHHQLMARELGHPTEAFDLVAIEVMKPFFKELAGILQKVQPDVLEEKGLMLDMLSIFAQVLYFNFARVPVTRITGNEYDSTFRAQLVDHIIGFSLQGIGGAEGRLQP